MDNLIFLSSLGLLFVIQTMYYLLLFTSLPRQKKKEQRVAEDTADHLPPISVIIVAEDLYEKLEKNLPFVLEQDYPQFEVIVVYNQSSDETDILLCQLKLKYTNLYHTFVPDDRKQLSHRKLGITMGIKASHNDWLVFTSPSCVPASNQWLRQMARNFTNGTSVVLGSTQYAESRKIWHRYIQFDLFFEQLSLLSLAAFHRPHAAYGTNMAYHKSQFSSNRGFIRQLDIERGEDNILINEIATRSNTKVEISPSSLVTAVAPAHKSIWHNEKIYRAQSNHRLRGFGKICLGFENFSRLLLVILSVAGIAAGALLHDNSLCYLSASLLIAYWTMQSIVLKVNAKILNGHISVLMVPLWSILKSFVDLWYSIKGRHSNK